MVTKTKIKVKRRSAGSDSPLVKGVPRQGRDLKSSAADGTSFKKGGTEEKKTPAVPVPDVERPSPEVAAVPIASVHADTPKTSEGEVPQAQPQPRHCVHCESADFVKRGLRKNKFGVAQLYICRNPACGRTFTARYGSLGENLGKLVRKVFPLKIVIECMSHYNLGFTFEQACSIVKQKFGAAPDPQTASAWYEEYKPLCRYERLRPWAVKYCKPTETVEVVTMAHRQLYRFRYHRAKTYLMLEEFRNRNLKPLKEYLDNVSSETPHQYFSEGGRMSEIKSKFDKADMIVKSKTNFANHLAGFVLPSVTENKHRHEELQRFFIANDSVTVATEVPVYIRKEDIQHMENVLKFKITGPDGHLQTRDVLEDAHLAKGLVLMKGHKRPIPFPNLLTGHIDFVQIRNGCVHLLDYKPNAAKEQPIEQLTWYAMAMSRLTGLRLFEFKCGWFDEKEYFEFYPLHVVKKLNYKRRRNVRFKDGSKVEVPRGAVSKATVV